LVRDAWARGAEVVCFPEAYLPGLRGQGFDVPPWSEAKEERVVQAVSDCARAQRIAVILGLERLTSEGRRISAVVFGAGGVVLGEQTKNQLDPTEDRYYVPGHTRRLFEVNGVAFGVAICHEGWRYPETVRWAAVRGAKVVFHPQLTGTVREGARLTTWGAPDAPYYERAMTCRALENTIYFASVNYAVPFQESATSVIDPAGRCLAHLPYGEEGVLTCEIDVAAATGLLARRFEATRYEDEAGAKASS
jgi:predicted amidohydrolase